MPSHRRRGRAIAAALALMGSALAGLIVAAPVAVADVTQNNGCLGVTGTFSQFAVPITGTAAPDPITLGTTTTLSNTSVAIAVDSTLIGAGVNTGLVTSAPSLADIGTAPDVSAPNGLGVNAVTAASGKVTLKINATHTTEGQQTATNPSPVAITFYVVQDPSTLAVSVYTDLSSPPSTSPDPSRTGTLLVGNLPVTIPLGDTTWTATGGNIVFSEVNSQPANLLSPSASDQDAAPLILLPKINGVISTPFHCWPGTVATPVPPATSSPLTPGASLTIDTVTVNTPPLPPSCSNLTTSAPAGQSITINLNAQCSDANGNIDPTTWSVTTPTAGTLSPTATPGVYSYTAPATDPGTPVTFDFSVSDTDPQASNTASVSIAILGNLCDATAGDCSLRQVITVPVLGATRTLEQAGSTITMISAASIAGPDGIPGTGDDTPASAAPIVLNGNPQLAVGRLNQMTVTNARGDDASWTLSGQVTSFLDAFRYPDRTAAGVPTCLATDSATWDNHCIPGDNLGWVPASAIAHIRVPGDVASVSSGSALYPPHTPVLNDTTDGVTGITGSPTGLTSAKTLCSSPTNHSGGTFTCDAGLALEVPASAAAGAYVAVLTLTLA